MAKFSLDLRDLEAAAALEALGMVPETQWPGIEASTLEMSTDSEVTFRKVLGSAEVLATRPGVDPLEVTRPLPEFGWTSQSPQATSPSVIARRWHILRLGRGHQWLPTCLDLRPLRSTQIYRIGKAAKPQIGTTRKTPVPFTCYILQRTLNSLRQTTRKMAFSGANLSLIGWMILFHLLQLWSDFSPGKFYIICWFVSWHMPVRLNACWKHILISIDAASLRQLYD